MIHNKVREHKATAALIWIYLLTVGWVISPPALIYSISWNTEANTWLHKYEYWVDPCCCINASFKLHLQQQSGQITHASPKDIFVKKSWLLPSSVIIDFKAFEVKICWFNSAERLHELQWIILKPPWTTLTKIQLSKRLTYFPWVATHLGGNSLCKPVGVASVSWMRC